MIVHDVKAMGKGQDPPHHLSHSYSIIVVPPNPPSRTVFFLVVQAQANASPRCMPDEVSLIRRFTRDVDVLGLRSGAVIPWTE